MATVMGAQYGLNWSLPLSIIVRVLLFLTVLVSQSAHGVGLERFLAPAEAVGLLAKFCIETDADSRRAEALVTGLRLPPTAIGLKQNRDGVSMSLEIESNARLEIEIEATGKVRSCKLRIKLDDPSATFAIVQKRYQLGGQIDDYPPGHQEWLELTSPGSVSLSANFTFATQPSLSGTSVGSMVVIVMPSTP